MAKKKTKKPAPTGTTGSVLVGGIPGGATVEAFVAEHKPILTTEQWETLGRPTVAVRYHLGRSDEELYGFTYCHTGLRPDRRIALTLITPANCRGVDVGVVSPGGSVWMPASLMPISDTGLAADYVQRRTGVLQPMCYWDYSLTEENVARYLWPDGLLHRTPFETGAEDDPDPAALLREQDDGNPNAADAADKEGE